MYGVKAFGISIMLSLATFSFLLAINVRSAPNLLFEDGFESGDFSSWTDIVKDNDATLQVRNSQQHLGSYSSYSWVTDITNSSAYMFKTLRNSHTTFHARAYVCIAEATTISNRFSEIMVILDPTNTHPVAALLVRGNGSNSWWQVVYRNGDGWSFSWLLDTISLNSWYCVELKVVVGPGVGEIGFWLNGNSKFNGTNLDNDNQTTSVATLRLGCTSSPVVFGAGSNLGLYIDDVSIAENYIGTKEQAYSNRRQTPTELAVLLMAISAFAIATIILLQKRRKKPPIAA